MVNESTLNKYTLEEQMAMMKKAEELERENEKRQAVYQNQLTNIQSEISRALDSPLAKQLGINIDIDKLSDKSYVRIQREHLSKLFDNINKQYNEEMTRVLIAYQGIEGQRGV